MSKKKATKKKPTKKKPTKKKAVKEAVPCVSTVPIHCPRCGCSDRTRKTGTIRRTLSGSTSDGFDYTEVLWSYVTCRGCEKNYRIIEYLAPTSRTCGVKPGQ